MDIIEEVLILVFGLSRLKPGLLNREGLFLFGKREVFQQERLLFRKFEILFQKKNGIPPCQVQSIDLCLGKTPRNEER